MSGEVVKTSTGEGVQSASMSSEVGRSIPEPQLLTVQEAAGKAGLSRGKFRYLAQWLKLPYQLVRLDPRTAPIRCYPDDVVNGLIYLRNRCWGEGAREIFAALMGGRT